ncbi:MAG: tetratricopeptide repeat protein [Gemmatimonadetes bacterium]|nr:tetratricopeptide repeat protein [Gemmatimonadota bacterium]
MPTSAVRRTLVAAAISLASAGAAPAQQPAAPLTPSGEAVRDGRRLVTQGKLDEAMAQFGRAVGLDNMAADPHLQMGVVLDLQGRYAEARKHMEKALELARPEQRNGILRNIAFSYAFERNCAGAVGAARQAYDAEAAKPDWNTAAEVANEIGRLCIESGDYAQAQQWYKAGYDAAMKQPALPDSAKDLWNFRWHNALARLAARKGDAKGAAMHVGHAKGYFDAGRIPGQAPYMPYLTGYVAFYAGDYAAAIADLRQAQQGDPFILALLAQAYEKTGDQAQAMELWKKILTINIHNPTNAYARPLARQRVG